MLFPGELRRNHPQRIPERATTACAAVEEGPFGAALGFEINPGLKPLLVVFLCGVGKAVYHG